MAAKKCGYLRMWRIEDKHNGVGLTERYELQRQGIEVAKAGGKHLGRSTRKDHSDMSSSQ